ncbi:MAG: SLC13 family permease [Bacteroidota bacterium]
MEDKTYPLSKKIGLIAGPILFFYFLFFPLISSLNVEANKVIAVGILMLVWWITEAIPIAATALIPMIFFPLLGVNTMTDAAAPYSSPIVYLFMGGFVIALAMEKWNLHRRIALRIIQLTGTNANGIILGFMLATAVLSMWISNTATAVMMLPIATSVIGIFLKGDQNLSGNQKNFALSIMIGIAYAANIGGIATLVGTPPNVVFRGFMETTYQIEIPFADWLLIGIPYSAVFLTIAYFVLVKLMYPNKLGKFEGSAKVIKEEYKKLGKMNRQEILVSIIFFLTAFFWVFRTQLQPFISFVELSDPAIAMFFALVTFVIPYNLNRGKFLLKWQDTAKLPWGILLLFGGGLSLAKSMQQTGIIDLIGKSIAENNAWGPLAIVSILIAVMLFMTEVMSNVALVTILLPVVGGIAQGLGIEPILAAIPVTIASSCAFMLPMATPPNAIVFASGHIQVSQMARAGIILNIIAVILLIIMYQTLIPLVF